MEDVILPRSEVIRRGLHEIAEQRPTIYNEWVPVFIKWKTDGSYRGFPFDDPAEVFATFCADKGIHPERFFYDNPLLARQAMLNPAHMINHTPEQFQNRIRKVDEIVKDLPDDALYTPPPLSPSLLPAHEQVRVPDVAPIQFPIVPYTELPIRLQPGSLNFQHIAYSIARIQRVDPSVVQNWPTVYAEWLRTGGYAGYPIADPREVFATYCLAQSVDPALIFPNLTSTMARANQNITDMIAHTPDQWIHRAAEIRRFRRIYPHHPVPDELWNMSGHYPRRFERALISSPLPELESPIPMPTLASVEDLLQRVPSIPLPVPTLPLSIPLPIPTPPPLPPMVVLSPQESPLLDALTHTVEVMNSWRDRVALEMIPEASEIFPGSFSSDRIGLTVPAQPPHTSLPLPPTSWTTTVSPVSPPVSLPVQPQTPSHPGWFSDFSAFIADQHANRPVVYRATADQPLSVLPSSSVPSNTMYNPSSPPTPPSFPTSPSPPAPFTPPTLLTPPTPPTPPKISSGGNGSDDPTGLGTTCLWTGLVVVGVAAAGAIGYTVYKRWYPSPTIADSSERLTPAEMLASTSSESRSEHLTAIGEMTAPALELENLTWWDFTFQWLIHDSGLPVWMFNSPDRLLFWATLGVSLVVVVTSWLVYRATRKIKQYFSK